MAGTPVPQEAGATKAKGILGQNLLKLLTGKKEKEEQERSQESAGLQESQMAGDTHTEDKPAEEDLKNAKSVEEPVTAKSASKEEEGKSP